MGVRVCVVCHKNILTFTRRIGRPNAVGRSRSLVSSSEGFYFNKHWLCNSCFGKCLEYHEFKQKQV